MYLVFLLTGTPSRPENPGTPIGPCVSKQPRVLYNYVIWSKVCSFSFAVNVNVTLSPFGPDGPFSPPWPFSPLGPGCPMPPRGPSAPGRPTSPRGPGRPWNKRGGIITTIYSHCWEISCLIGESLGYRELLMTQRYSVYCDGTRKYEHFRTRIHSLGERCNRNILLTAKLHPTSIGGGWKFSFWGKLSNRFPLRLSRVWPTNRFGWFISATGR